MKHALRDSTSAAAALNTQAGRRGVTAFLRRLRTWGTESLLARALAVVAGLILLAAIGRSAVAGARPVPTANEEGSPSAANPLPVPSGTTTPSAATLADPAPIPVSPSPPASAGSRSRATAEDPVILNTATETDLRRLPGIGAKRAQLILALRARLGRFHQIEDLMKVKGIGRATLKKLRPLVLLEARRDTPASPKTG